MSSVPGPDAARTKGAPWTHSATRDAWRQEFAAEGVDGAMVVLLDADSTVLEYRRDRCKTRYIPASTFKIPNSLIALETGVVDGPSFSLPWDGVERPVPSWNRDHDLGSAFRFSVVWFYQELARRVGQPRMQEWMRRLDYGNQDISGGIDSFWLDGGVRISPREQVIFMKRLREGRLPVSPRSMDIVKQLMVLERGEGSVLRGKTGWSAESKPIEVGWFVGWLEKGDRVGYFATLILSPPPGKMKEARRAVTERVLRTLM